MVTAEDIEPIKRTRLSEEVLKRLQKMIIEGSLKPSDQLPCERELAEMFGVSRASIREALRILEAMGFIEAKVGVGGGTYVKAISIEGLLNPFSEILGCEKELIVEMIEFRRVLEVEIARKAAQKRTDEDLARLEASIELMAQEIENGDIGLKGDNAFHEALALASHNRVFEQMLSMAKSLLCKTKKSSLQIEGQPPESLRAHKAILEAVKKQDTESAAKYMAKHLARAKELAEGVL